ncbi:hypothetical protein CWS02_17715 [Enterobacter sp. EA-1]|nr:hypothetical protein CWS02_17715 [Enterobacter sp. EA-1]
MWAGRYGDIFNPSGVDIAMKIDGFMRPGAHFFFYKVPVLLGSSHLEKKRSPRRNRNEKLLRKNCRAHSVKWAN